MAHQYCHQCGEKFISLEWPRRCHKCPGVAWGNPVPVVVAAVRVPGGVLLIRRAQGLGKGLLALPGGYLDHHEAWQDGCARELLEETGLELHPEEFTLLTCVSSSNRENLVLFGIAQASRVPEFKPSQEVSELLVIDRPIELAFPSHTQVLSRLFEASFRF